MQGKECRLDLMRIQVHRRIKERHGYAIQTPAGTSRQIMGVVLGVVCRDSVFHEIGAPVFSAVSGAQSILLFAILYQTWGPHTRATDVQDLAGFGRGLSPAGF